MDEATPEQKAEGMKGWLKWKDKMGDNLIDIGTPLVGGQRLNKDGTSLQVSNGVAGYSILQANSMAEAKSLLMNHPHLQWTDGCKIEVYESIAM
jgi:hypothetical protein